MHRVYRELRASGVTNIAALSQRIGIRQEVGRFRFRDMASAASRRIGLHRIDPPLGIGDQIQAGGQNLLAAIGVADRAVLHVSGVSRGAHDREEDAGEIVNASPMAHDDVGGLGAGWHGIHAIVNTVNQQIEVDALCRLSLVRRDHGGGARGGIGVRRIVT